MYSAIHRSYYIFIPITQLFATLTSPFTSSTGTLLTPTTSLGQLWQSHNLSFITLAGMVTQLEDTCSHDSDMFTPPSLTCLLSPLIYLLSELWQTRFGSSDILDVTILTCLLSLQWQSDITGSKLVVVNLSSLEAVPACAPWPDYLGLPVTIQYIGLEPLAGVIIGVDA